MQLLNIPNLEPSKCSYKTKQNESLCVYVLSMSFNLNNLIINDNYYHKIAYREG